jgi:hypothetical protein
MELSPCDVTSREVGSDVGTVLELINGSLN